jgi:hypothetical protein
VQVRRRGDAEGAVRPLLAALPQLCLALLVLAVGFGTGIAWPWVLAIACSLGFIALLRAARAAVELERRRQAADEWLLMGAAARPSSALLSWRAGELTSPRLRSTLAHSLRRIEREVRGGTLRGPPPTTCTGAAASPIRCSVPIPVCLLSPAWRPGGRPS